MAEFVATFYSFEKWNYFFVILMNLSLFYFKHASVDLSSKLILNIIFSSHNKLKYKKL